MRFDRAVILHGKPSGERAAQPGFDPSRANFLGWLADELMSRGVQVVAPKIESPEAPDFNQYLTKLHDLKDFINGVGPSVGSGKWPTTWKNRRGSYNCLIVAHSAAVGPVLEWSASSIVSVGARVMAVAPWFDPAGMYPEMRMPNLVQGSSYAEQDRVRDHLSKLVKVVASDKDDDEATESLRWLMDPEQLPGLDIVRFAGMGHFVTGNSLAPDYPLGNGLNGSTCPELLNVVDSFRVDRL